MAEHDHAWAFAYAALARNQTFTVHYECRDSACRTTRAVHGLTRADVLALRSPGLGVPVAWTPQEARRLHFWREMVIRGVLGADDQVAAESPAAPIAL